LKMKFLNQTLSLWLLVVPAINGFQIHDSTWRQSNPKIPGSLNIKTSSLFSSTVESSEPTSKKVEKPLLIKKQRENIAKKKDYLRGAGVFKEVKTQVTQDMKNQFDSELMNKMRENPNYMLEKDGIEIYLAKEHGFCWGVERSINLAYSAIETFPDATLHLTNDLIHNPMVNEKLNANDVNFIEKDKDNNKDFTQINEGDVVMLPAFGATLEEMKELDAKNVKVVDTTCPWVAKVWNTVHTHQVRGLTSVIHGKYGHEETIATKSMCETYLCVKDPKEAEYLVDFMLNAEEGDGRAEEFMAKFSKACSSHFDPHTHLKKIGLANQTTMYKKETRAIGQMLQKTMMKKFGPDLINEHYYEFDTICDATQVRQDAVDELCNMHHDPDQPVLDFILVVGGFDSSNTCHLLEIPQLRGVPSYHINSAECITAANSITHRKMDGEIVEKQIPFLEDSMLWTIDEDDKKSKKPLRIGVTSGASTPDKDVQDCLGRLMMLNSVLSEKYA